MEWVGFFFSIHLEVILSERFSSFSFLCELRIQWKIFFCGCNIAIKFEPNRVQFIHECFSSDENSSVCIRYNMHLLESVDVLVKFHFSTFNHSCLHTKFFSFHFFFFGEYVRVCAVLTVTIITACIAR